jgi:hypothetical protein
MYLLYINYKNTIEFIDHTRLLAIIVSLRCYFNAIQLMGNIYSHCTITFTSEYFEQAQPVHISKNA